MAARARSERAGTRALATAAEISLTSSTSFRRAASTISGSRASSASVQATSRAPVSRSEEHTSELQSLMRISYAVFCLKKKKTKTTQLNSTTTNKRHEL